MFLRVRAPGTVIYSNLARLLGRPAARYDHRPSIKTARTPTDKSVWGIYTICYKKKPQKIIKTVVKVVKSIFKTYLLDV